jgi:hypothetical protein
MQALAISTTNFQTFAELAFTFTTDAANRRRVARVRARDGIRRRFLPAARAARLKIVDALRAA